MKTFLPIAWNLSLTMAMWIAPFPVSGGESGRVLPIDLASALKLADADNTRIALAREKVIEAEADLAAAKALLIPDLSVGASYHRHDGQLQETNGNIQDVSRSSSFAGLGAGAVGAGDVQVAGVGLKVDLADAWYAPLAAHQRGRAASAESEAVRNRIHQAVATAYFELLRSRGGLQIAEEAFANATALEQTTASFAQTGQGLESDSERAAVEALVRKRDIAAAEERLTLASVRLAALLQLEPTVELIPGGRADAKVSWIDPGSGLDDLIALALSRRPEIVRTETELAAARRDWEQQRLGPYFPSVSLGASVGGFGGDRDSTPAQWDDRTDFSAAVFWQLEGMGFGDRASSDRAASLFRQSEIDRRHLENAVAAEVASAWAKVGSREKQIAIGRDAVERASRSYELNLSRVFENQGLPIEVLQAIQSLVSARLLYLDSVIDFNIAQFELYTATGAEVVAVGGGTPAVPSSAESLDDGDGKEDYEVISEIRSPEKGGTRPVRSPVRRTRLP